MDVGVGEPLAEPPAIARELEAEFSKLEQLEEDELLALIGSQSMGPMESAYAALSTYSPEIAEQLPAGILTVETPVDLIARGRRRVQRILEECGDAIARKACPLFENNAARVELAIVIAIELMSLLPVGGAVAGAVAFHIAKYLLEQLCKRLREGQGLPAEPA